MLSWSYLSFSSNTACFIIVILIIIVHYSIHLQLLSEIDPPGY